MSAGGGNGYYKHRCKYYYTHNCENWIWVANTACSTCIVRMFISLITDDMTLDG